MPHFVPEYNEPFGIHVDTQTVSMFPYISDTYDVFHIWYVPGVIHPLSYVWYNHGSKITPSKTTECCCFLLLAAIVRLYHTGARACSLCVVVYPLLLHEIFFICEDGGGAFFNTHLVGCLAFFQLCASQSTRANKRNDCSSVTASGRYQRGVASYLP